MIKQYVKKPIPVSAIQWNGNTNKKEVEEFVGKELKTKVYSDTAYEAGAGQPFFSLLIETLEGVMEAIPGSYIIRGIHGEFYPCKESVFEESYEEYTE